MTTWHKRSKRKVAGGILRPYSKNKKYQRGRDYEPAEIGETRLKQMKTKGGGKKQRLLSSLEANVHVGGKIKKAKILTVSANPADIQFVRRNIITKGAIIQTELGKAIVTSRPGQSGVIYAKLIEEKEK